MSDNIKISARIPVSLFNRVKKIAEKDGISFTAALVQLLEEEVKS